MAAAAAVRWLRLLSRLLMASFMVATAFWIGGLIWFTNAIVRPAEPLPPHADGIVALTGGAGRVELGLHLLAQGRADRLLLSGVGGGTDLATIGHLSNIDPTSLADRITLGRYAASTRGNGVEAAAWAERNNISSLIVVTASFHMPRALAELRQSLPRVQLFPMPVNAARERETGDDGVSLRLQAAEYTKYLLTAFGLSRFFPRREAVTTAGMPAGTGG